MSRSYLSKRQVKWERASLDIQEAKHKNLVAYRDRVFAVWNPDDCEHEGPGCMTCASVRKVVSEDVEWSERDLQRWRRKVERLEREQSRKRRVKRVTKRWRREQREAERLL